MIVLILAIVLVGLTALALLSLAIIWAIVNKDIIGLYKETITYKSIWLIPTAICSIVCISIAFSIKGQAYMALIPAVISGILAVVFFSAFATVFPYIKSVSTTIKRSINCGYLSITCGVPGTGKTRTEVFLSAFIARARWKELRFEYWLYLRVKDKLDTTSDKYKYWLQVDKAYQFYKDNEDKYIPCLSSNIKIKDKKGRICYLLRKEHMEQQLPLPYFVVCLYDEYGQDFGVDKSRKGADTKDFDEQDRYVRQWGFTYRLTEQDMNQVAIATRRVTWKNTQLISCKEVCTPNLLVLYKSVLTAIYRLKYDKGCPPKKKAKLDKLAKRINSIGFIVYKCQFTGSTEQIEQKVSRERLVITRKPYAVYDTYGCSELYKAKDKPLIVKAMSWVNIESMKVDNKDRELYKEDKAIKYGKLEETEDKQENEQIEEKEQNNIELNADAEVKADIKYPF